MESNKLTKEECEEIIRIILNSKVYTPQKSKIMYKLCSQIKENGERNKN